MNVQRISRFLSGVKRHNNKAYFDTVRNEWSQIKEEIIEFTMELMNEMQDFDPAIAMIDPKSTLYRINRDIRFSKDKSPYKTWIAVGITPQKKSAMKPTYYFHIDHQGYLEYGAGAWGIPPEDTKALRAAIIQHPQDFLDIMSTLQQSGLYLTDIFKKSRVPNGYPKDLAISEYLKYTSFAVDGARTEIKTWNTIHLKKHLLHFFHSV